MHRTLTATCRKLLQEYPEAWEEVIPYYECTLRITPLKSLGGRSGIVQLVWSAIERGQLYVEVGDGFYNQVQTQDVQSISSCLMYWSVDCDGDKLHYSLDDVRI